MASERFEAIPQAILDALQVLNEAVRLEPDAISALMFNRVTIGEELAHHPTIQCRQVGRDRYEVSALGLINGLFGADEDHWGFIFAHVDNEDPLKITHFSTSAEPDFDEIEDPEVGPDVEIG